MRVPAAAYSVVHHVWHEKTDPKVLVRPTALSHAQNLVGWKRNTFLDTVAECSTVSDHSMHGSGECRRLHLCAPFFEWVTKKITNMLGPTSDWCFLVSTNILVIYSSICMSLLFVKSYVLFVNEMT